MEDLPGADSPPINDVGHEPAGNDDPQDPLRPEIEEEDAARTPPIADPHLDTEVAEDDDNPQLSMPDAADNDNDDFDADSDALSDVDEAQFQDFDPNAIAIEERPRVVDASGVALLGKHKRKRDDADGEGKKKRREGRREKPKRSKRTGEDGGDFDGDEEGGERRRKTKAPSEKRKKRTPSPEDDSNLTPEESECLLQVEGMHPC
jgi:transcription factor SPN1